MTATLTIGCALLAFGPFISLFSLIVSQKAQLVIVVTTSAFFFLLGSVGASFSWWIFHAIGLNGPLAAIIPGVFFQFVARCSFVAIYHKVERSIQIALHKQHEQERKREQQQQQQETSRGTDDTVRPPLPQQPRRSGANNTNNNVNNEDWMEIAKLRLELNDAACGVAAGVGFGGMHAILLYGTLLASQATNNVGILYQDSCPNVPSLAVSALLTFAFSILDVFWMLFTFFGMRRRLLYHRGCGYDDANNNNNNNERAIGGWFGNSRFGGNLALLFTLVSHFVASIMSTADYFKHGCTVSLTSLAVIVLFTAYMFWAGVGRIYMPPAQSLTVTDPIE